MQAVPIATRLPLKGGNACTRKYVRSISSSEAGNWTARIADLAIHSLEVKFRIANGLDVIMF
jgi:hypothetical protein